MQIYNKAVYTGGNYETHTKYLILSSKYTRVPHKFFYLYETIHGVYSVVVHSPYNMLYHNVAL